MNFDVLLPLALFLISLAALRFSQSSLGDLNPFFRGSGSE